MTALRVVAEVPGMTVSINEFVGFMTVIVLRVGSTGDAAVSKGPRAVMPGMVRENRITPLPEVLIAASI